MSEKKKWQEDILFYNPDVFKDRSEHFGLGDVDWDKMEKIHALNKEKKLYNKTDVFLLKVVREGENKGDQFKRYTNAYFLEKSEDGEGYILNKRRGSQLKAYDGCLKTIFSNICGIHDQERIKYKINVLGEKPKKVKYVLGEKNNVSVLEGIGPKELVGGYKIDANGQGDKSGEKETNKNVAEFYKIR